jgi:aryl-alcohol dehydrogenase
LGHEGTDIVERVGPDVEAMQVGDHVIMSIPNDGTCENCRSGHPRWCVNGETLMFSGKRYDGSALSRYGKTVAAHLLQQPASPHMSSQPR